MKEIELKFLIPEARLTGLLRQVKVKSSQTIQLAAHYFDTPNQTLAKAGIGLRIRQEDNDWTQTIKAGGDGIAARLEHNTPLDNEQVQAMLNNDNLMPDLTLYQDTFIAPTLAEFKLKKLAERVRRQYVTDVQRTTRLLKAKDEQDIGDNNNSIIEVAYDYGEIIHGSDASLRHPIHEIEFELVSGELSFLFATAKVWCKRYKLCLSTVTKAEQGSLLIKGQDYSPAVSANFAQPHVNQDTSRPEFIRAVVQHCLLQILPNSSAIVAGSLDNEHILQLYIGIHRLRIALKVFKKFSNTLNPDWLPILKQTERLLRDYRELAYLVSNIESKLEQQGAPKVDWSTELTRLKVSPSSAVLANDFQLALLELIEFTMSAASDEPQAHKSASAKLTKILSKKHIKLLKAEQHLTDLKDLNSDCYSVDGDNGTDNNSADLLIKAQRKVSRHLKDLRYISEFAAPLYDHNSSRRLLKQLTKAQQALEQYHDNQQYQCHYQNKSLIDTNALYGAGWFAGLAKSDLKRCQKCLAKVGDYATFW